MQAHEAEMHRHDEAVMTALRGPWKDEMIGHVRDERLGLVYQVGELWRRSEAEEHRKMKLAPADRAALWSVLLALIANAVGIRWPF